MDLNERVLEFTRQTMAAMGLTVDVVIDDTPGRHPRRDFRSGRRTVASTPRRGARRAPGHRQHRIPARGEGRPVVRGGLPRVPQGQGRRAPPDGALHDGEGEVVGPAGDRAAQSVLAAPRAPDRCGGSRRSRPRALATPSSRRSSFQSAVRYRSRAMAGPGREQRHVVLVQGTCHGCASAPRGATPFAATRERRVTDH